MDEINYQHQQVQDSILVHCGHKSYWKRIQSTMGFWLFLFLMLAGITYYKVTVNFIFSPHAHLKQSIENIIRP